MDFALDRFDQSVQPAPRRLPPVSWRDPHSVPPEELAAAIASIEEQCRLQPRSADLHTCLGMAYAMNYDAYKSMDALEHAVTCEPHHFWARLKYAELHYRLRALERAEQETKHALQLAGDERELSIARRQLQEIRRLRREGTQKPSWTKSLVAPAVAMGVFLILLSVVRVWR
jgi:cytochrome c-type biogenesis protein CcmH/NrfG